MAGVLTFNEISTRKILQREFDGVIDRINNKPRRIFYGLSSTEYSLMNS